jgi:hypothetical protein
MLKELYDMPVGTLGCEAVGEVDDDDVEDILVAPAGDQGAFTSAAGGGAGFSGPRV